MNSFYKLLDNANLANTSLVAIALLCAVGPSMSSWQAQDIDWQAIATAPSAQHWFGTDLVGRDLFVRTLEGARTSMLIALIATLVSVVIGVPWGATAGFIGGRTDMFMMRIVDALYGLPLILVAVLIVVLFGRNPYLLFAALGAFFWLDIARIVRGQTLALRQSLFVAAARCLGANNRQIILRHILPNVAGVVLTYATLTLPGVILAESFISFLGLGVQEPNTSWGVLIADGIYSMESAPWQLLFPAGLLVLTLWSCNTLGDRLRDQLNHR